MVVEAITNRFRKKSTMSEFLSHLMKYGIAYNNRFSVEIELPDAIRDATKNILQKKTTSPFGQEVFSYVKSFIGAKGEVVRSLNFMVNQIELPGKMLSTTETKYNSDVYTMAYGNTYEGLSIMFNISRDMLEKNIFDSWQELAYDPIKHKAGYFDDYKSNITINVLDANDRIVYSVRLIDAMPKTIVPIQLSQDDGSNMKMSVMFMYKRWERIEGNVSKDLDKLGSLSQTALGPAVTPLLSNPAIQSALGAIQSQTGLDLEGEALNIYNSVDTIVKQSTGTDTNKIKGSINSYVASAEISDKMTPQQKSNLIGALNEVLGKLG